MRRLGRLYALLVAGFAAGCFSVDYSGLNFTCDPSQAAATVCPDGYQCNASTKLCVAMGSGTTATDMAGTTPTDMASLVPVANGACPSGSGYDITAAGKSKVYACQTTFKNMTGMTADVQCKSPYTLCGGTGNIDLAACMRVGAATNGFFISSVEDARDNNNQSRCGPPSSQHPDPMWSGCGKMASVLSSGQNCQGFTQVLDCPASGSFSCAGGQGARIGDVTNTDQNNGVLCCAP